MPVTRLRYSAAGALGLRMKQQGHLGPLAWLKGLDNGWKPRACQYIISGSGRAAVFCNVPTDRGSYCHEHYARCHLGKESAGDEG